eukprot:4982545-Amphidinium_carterae.3
MKAGCSLHRPVAGRTSVLSVAGGSCVMRQWDLGRGLLWRVVHACRVIAELRDRAPFVLRGRKSGASRNADSALLGLFASSCVDTALDQGWQTREGLRHGADAVLELDKGDVSWPLLRCLGCCCARFKPADEFAYCWRALVLLIDLAGAVLGLAPGPGLW